MRLKTVRNMRIVGVGLCLAFLINVILLALAPYSLSQRPAPAPISTDIGQAPRAGSWVVSAQDTSINEDWRPAAQTPVTQMTTPDSLRVWTTGGSANTTKVTVVGISNADTMIKSFTSRLGTGDTMFVGTYKFSKFLGMYLDTSNVISGDGYTFVKAKTATGNITSIPPGYIQTHAAAYWFPKAQGVLTDLIVSGDPFGPMVEYQVRLYRHQNNAISTPERGFSVLYSGRVGGAPTIRPQAAKTLAAGAVDTSGSIFLSSPNTTYSFLSEITTVQSDTLAWYYIQSPYSVTSTATFWTDKIGIDSTTTAAALAVPRFRYKSLTLNSGGGSWYRFITKNQGLGTDTATVTTYITPSTWNSVIAPTILTGLNDLLPAQSAIIVFVRAFGKSGRINVTMKGTLLK